MSRKLEIARNMYKKSQQNRSPSFCECAHQMDSRGNISTDLCKCGENTSTLFHWKWNEEIPIPELVIEGGTVRFHPIYSQGTAAVKGDTALDKQMIHYWEIKIVSSMNGTDLMVGIGTNNVNLLSHQFKYTSLLGLDDQSWGYSYRGLTQHNGRLKYYGKRFSSFCIVGVYLDLRRRFLEFYLNRRPQGIAYRRLRIDDDAEIYPMAASTSSKSVVKLINAVSFTETLQYLCMKVVSKNQKIVEFIKSTPGLRYLCRDYWFLQSEEQFQYSEFADNNLLLEDVAILCCLRDRKYCDVDGSMESIIEEIDIYNGVNDIQHRKRSSSSSSDDDLDDIDMEHFCAHF